MNADSSYDLVFEDGDKRSQVPAASMRPVGTSTASSQSEPARGASHAQSAASSLAVPGGAGKFKAPDGTSFATKKEYRKYMVDNFFSFKDKSGETLMKKPGEINGQSFDIRNVKDCTLMVLDHSAQILMVSGASFGSCLGVFCACLCRRLSRASRASRFAIASEISDANVSLRAMGHRITWSTAASSSARWHRRSLFATAKTASLRLPVASFGRGMWRM